MAVTSTHKDYVTDCDDDDKLAEPLHNGDAAAEEEFFDRFQVTLIKTAKPGLVVGSPDPPRAGRDLVGLVVRFRNLSADLTSRKGHRVNVHICVTGLEDAERTREVSG